MGRNEKMTNTKINTIGFWTLIIILAIGAIVGGLVENKDVSEGCIGAAVFIVIVYFFVWWLHE